jgi:hypothetical protein
MTRRGEREVRRLKRMSDRVETVNTKAPTQDMETREKKPFVAPTISVPIDVLEATTFFQSVESGATN